MKLTLSSFHTVCEMFSSLCMHRLRRSHCDMMVVEEKNNNLIDDRCPHWTVAAGLETQMHVLLNCHAGAWQIRDSMIDTLKLMLCYSCLNLNPWVKIKIKKPVKRWVAQNKKKPHYVLILGYISAQFSDIFPSVKMMASTEFVMSRKTVSFKSSYCITNLLQYINMQMFFERLIYTDPT